MILNGKIEIRAGKEAFKSELGPFQPLAMEIFDTALRLYKENPNSTPEYIKSMINNEADYNAYAIGETTRLLKFDVT